MLVEGIKTYLAADTGVQALLGTPSQRRNNNTGMFPTLAPDGEQVPYIVYQQVTGNPLQESMKGTGRLQTERWRFSCHGSTYKSAKKLAKAVIKAMISLNGSLTDGQAFVQGCWKKMEADDAEPLAKGTLFATHCDFEINYLDLE